MFQVTLEVDAVWEYINLYFADGPLGVSNAVFRAKHYASGNDSALVAYLGVIDAADCAVLPIEPIPLSP